MILIKYNEIMNNVTVDPAMKSRIMSSVSAAIKEQKGTSGDAGNTARPGAVKAPETRRTPEVKKPPEIKKTQGPAKVTVIPQEEGEAPVRVKRKARKTPIVVISSIAAGILVIAGALFVFGNMFGASKSAAEAPAHNAAMQWDSAAETEAGYDSYAESTAAPVEAEDINYAAGETRDYSYDINNKNSLTAEVTTVAGITVDLNDDADEEKNDTRFDGIAGSLPFDIKGSGSGQFSETITEEVFFGNNGEKVLLFTAPEGTDMINVIYLDNSPESTVSELLHQNRAIEGVDGTSPDGTTIKLYRIAFGNVNELSEGETSSDVNAAVFTKNGYTYLLIFSDIQPVEVIGRVVDAV
jgi:hypothetical protein